MTEQQQNDGPLIPAWTRGDRMRKALNVAGIGVGEMADYLDVTPQTVARWTGDHSPVKRSTLILWSMRTGVDLTWLENGESPTQNVSGSLKLPRLDSNQQPSGYHSAQVIDLDSYRLPRAPMVFGPLALWGRA